MRRIAFALISGAVQLMAAPAAAQEAASDAPAVQLASVQTNTGQRQPTRFEIERAELKTVVALRNHIKGQADQQTSQINSFQRFAAKVQNGGCGARAQSAYATDGIYMRLAQRSFKALTASEDAATDSELAACAQHEFSTALDTTFANLSYSNIVLAKGGSLIGAPLEGNDEMTALIPFIIDGTAPHRSTGKAWTSVYARTLEEVMNRPVTTAADLSGGFLRPAGEEDFMARAARVRPAASITVASRNAQNNGDAKRAADRAAAAARAAQTAAATLARNIANLETEIAALKVKCDAGKRSACRTLARKEQRLNALRPPVPAAVPADPAPTLPVEVAGGAVSTLAALTNDK